MLWRLGLVCCCFLLAGAAHGSTDVAFRVVPLGPGEASFLALDSKNNLVHVGMGGISQYCGTASLIVRYLSSQKNIVFFYARILTSSLDV